MPLTITRKTGQSVHAGPVVVTVVSVEGSKVRLSFDAPKEVPIVRSELTRDEAEPVERIEQL